MSKNMIEHWLGESEENRRLFAQEELILAITERVADVMEAQELDRAELARRLGTSKANVSQLLCGSRNMTLRTLADLATALGMRVSLQLVDEAEVNDWTDAPETSLLPRIFAHSQEVDAANDDWRSVEAVKL